MAIHGRALRVIRKWAGSPLGAHVEVTFVEASAGQVILDIPKMIPHEVAMQVERETAQRQPSCPETWRRGRDSRLRWPGTPTMPAPMAGVVGLAVGAGAVAAAVSREQTARWEQEKAEMGMRVAGDHQP